MQKPKFELIYWMKTNQKKAFYIPKPNQTKRKCQEKHAIVTSTNVFIQPNVNILTSFSKLIHHFKQ